MKLRPHRVLFVSLLALVCAGSPPVPGEPLHDAAVDGLRIRFVEIPESAEERLDALQRVRLGAAVLALIEVPSARALGGDLIDPASVQASYGDSPAEVRLVYRLPHLAVAAILPDPTAFEADPHGEIELTAATLGSGEAATAHLALDTPTSPTLQRRGQAVRLIDPTGAPIDGGFVFGQKINSLFGRSDPNGRVLLDFPGRSTLDPHLAWAPGFWTVPFDARTTWTITLPAIHPWDAEEILAGKRHAQTALTSPGADPDAPIFTRTRPVTLEVEFPGAGGAQPFVVEVAGRYWAVSREGRPVNLSIPDLPNLPATMVLSAGYLPARVELQPAAEGGERPLIRLPLVPLPSLPAAENKTGS